MKFNREMNPTLLCGRDDLGGDPALRHPALDIDDKTGDALLVVTDGHRLIAMPVDVDEDDVPGLVQRLAVEAARKDHHPHLVCEEDSVTIPQQDLRFLGRPDAKPIDWRAVLPEAREGGVTVSFNVDLLVGIVKALGGGYRHGQVQLTIYPNEEGQHDLSPIPVHVRGAPVGTTAILMPLRED